MYIQKIMAFLEIRSFHEAKTKFLSLLVWELLTFDNVESNRSPLWAIDRKILLGPDKVKTRYNM